MKYTGFKRVKRLDRRHKWRLVTSRSKHEGTYIIRYHRCTVCEKQVCVHEFGAAFLNLTTRKHLVPHLKNYIYESSTLWEKLTRRT